MDSQPKKTNKQKCCKKKHHEYFTPNDDFSDLTKMLEKSFAFIVNTKNSNNK